MLPFFGMTWSTSMKAVLRAPTWALHPAKLHFDEHPRGMPWSVFLREHLALLRWRRGPRLARTLCR